MQDHVANIGEMLEEMEGRVRGSLYEVYFGKTQEVDYPRNIRPNPFVTPDTSGQIPLLPLIRAAKSP